MGPRRLSPRKVSKLLAHHQRLVDEKGFPPSRLMLQVASAAAAQAAAGARRMSPKKLCKLLAHHQRLVDEKGLPPSRLMLQVASAAAAQTAAGATVAVVPRALARPPDPAARPNRGLIEDAGDQRLGAARARRGDLNDRPYVDRTQHRQGGRLRISAASSGTLIGSLQTASGGSPPCPPRWYMRTQEGESGGTIIVSANSLEGAYSLLESAMKGPGRGLFQQAEDGGAGLRHWE